MSKILLSNIKTRGDTVQKDRLKVAGTPTTYAESGKREFY